MVIPDVAIVTYNTDYYLLNLLDSLAPVRAAGLVGDVHVWDNASADDTAALLETYASGAPWLRPRRSPINVHHGPALDRLLRESCRREWVLVLDADTEVRRSLADVLKRDELAEAAFVGQIHPQMPQLYAYLAHLLVHRPSYLELPPFRHHGAPGIDYFRAVEVERRKYVRFRWSDAVHHFGQGSLRRVVERGDRDHVFYDFACAEAARHPKSAARLARESAFQARLASLLRRAGSGSGGRDRDRRLDAPTEIGGDEGRRQVTEVGGGGRRLRRPAIAWQFWLRSPRRARALAAATRLGLTQKPDEIWPLLRLVERLRPRRVLELGTTHGGSFLLWAAAAARDASLLSIGLPPWEMDDPGELEKRRAIERVGGRRQHVHVLRRRPDDPDAQVRAREWLGGEPADFLFIASECARDIDANDFRDYAGLVRPGGLVAMDDIEPHPRRGEGAGRRLWREMRDGRRHAEFVAGREEDGFGIGVIWK